jgi:phosphotransacetylase
MLTSFEEIKAQLGQLTKKKRIGVVAAQDEHTLDAVVLAANDGLVEPVLLGKKSEITVLLEHLDQSASGFEIHDIESPEDCAARAAQMVRGGELDCLIKGKIETAAMMKAVVNKDTGIRDSDTMSHISFFESPFYHKLFAMTDGGLLTYPTLEQKKSAIENAAKVFHKLGIQLPKVAVLAAIDTVNPKMKETVEAAELKSLWKSGTIPGCIVEGPISYDLAMQKDAADIKGYESPVAGDADILVVPDIACGNILLKALSCTGNAKFAGAVVGARVPIVITSRSMSMHDKYLSIVLNAVVGKL